MQKKRYFFCRKINGSEHLNHPHMTPCLQANAATLCNGRIRESVQEKNAGADWRAKSRQGAMLPQLNVATISAVLTTAEQKCALSSGLVANYQFKSISPE